MPVFEALGRPEAEPRTQRHSVARIGSTSSRTPHFLPTQVASRSAPKTLKEATGPAAFKRSTLVNRICSVWQRGPGGTRRPTPTPDPHEHPFNPWVVRAFGQDHPGSPKHHRRLPVLPQGGHGLRRLGWPVPLPSLKASERLGPMRRQIHQPGLVQRRPLRGFQGTRACRTWPHRHLELCGPQMAHRCRSTASLESPSGS